MITIRRAAHTDAEAVVTLWLTLMAEQHRLDPDFAIADDAGERWLNDFDEWVDAPEVRMIAVAESENQLVGFASAQLWWPPPVYDQALEVYLDELFVAPDSRRQGVGTQLYNAVREWAAEREVTRIRLGTLAANNEAINFWKKQGAKDFLVAMIVPFHTTSN